jgi:flagellar export protein FliJ
MSWRQSLIRISTYEVEVLQKRLSEVVERRTHAELKLAMLEAQAQAEMDHARRDGDAAMRLGAYMTGVRERRAAITEEIAQIGHEETGARDALAGAFEAMKKFEQIAEMARVAEMKETARRETAALDEMGLRSKAG